MKPTRREVLASFAGAAMPRLSRPLVMGFIYNGPKNDLGYNQSHADGKQALRVLPWVKAVEEASVPETVAAEESMRDMIFQDGASVIFATSFGHYDPFTIDVARENPRVQFFHCGGLYEEGKHPKNIGIYFGFIVPAAEKAKEALKKMEQDMKKFEQDEKKRMEDERTLKDKKN